MENKNIILSSDQSLLEVYNDKPWAKAIIQLIPYAGTLINEILSHKGNKITEQRLEGLFNALYECIKDLDNITLKKDWANSEEFYDILQVAIESCIRTRSKEKMQLNAMLLCSFLNNENKDSFTYDEYLGAINDLTPLELNVLVSIYKRVQLVQKKPTFNDLEYAKELDLKNWVKEKCEIEEDIYEFIIKRLERTGFIREITGSYLSYTGGQYTLTEAFKKLVDYLNKSEKNLLF